LKGCAAYHVHAGAEHVALDKLRRIATGDGFNLRNAEFAGVDLDTTLGTTEGDVDDGTLVGHERGKSHHLLLVDVLAVADTALARKAVVAVLNTEALNNHGVVLAGLLIEIDTHGELDAVDGGALPDVGCEEREISKKSDLRIRLRSVPI
jgi:hypothetical protein